MKTKNKNKSTTTCARVTEYHNIFIAATNYKWFPANQLEVQKN